MTELRAYQMDNTMEIKEVWYDFENPEKTKVRIHFNYTYSKKMMYDN